jgi:hypothetical protein
MSTQPYPDLQQFLGCYFHQDFLMEYASPDAAITAFISDEPEEFVRAACRELGQVIPVVEQLDDPERFLLETLGCWYYPKAQGSTVVEWLKHVHVRLCE